MQTRECGASEGSKLDVRTALCLLTIAIDTNFEEGSNATRRSCLRDAFKTSEEFQTMHLSTTASFCNQEATNHLREVRLGPQPSGTSASKKPISSQFCILSPRVCCSGFHFRLLKEQRCYPWCCAPSNSVTPPHTLGREKVLWAATQIPK